MDSFEQASLHAAVELLQMDVQASQSSEAKTYTYTQAATQPSV